MLTRRWRALRDHADYGMTLIEVMVGMTLLSIVSAVALSFFYVTLNSTSTIASRSNNSIGPRVAIDQIAALLRVADTPTSRPGDSSSRFVYPPKVSPSSPDELRSDEIIFYANIGMSSRSGTAPRTPPSKVIIQLVDGKLYESITRPTHAYTTYPSGYDDPTSPNYFANNYGAASSSTVLLTHIINLDVFAYYSDFAATPTATGTPTYVAASATPVSPSPTHVCDQSTPVTPTSGGASQSPYAGATTSPTNSPSSSSSPTSPTSTTPATPATTSPSAAGCSNLTTPSANPTPSATSAPSTTSTPPTTSNQTVSACPSQTTTTPEPYLKCTNDPDSVALVRIKLVVADRNDARTRQIATSSIAITGAVS